MIDEAEVNMTVGDCMEILSYTSDICLLVEDGDENSEDTYYRIDDDLIKSVPGSSTNAEGTVGSGIEFLLGMQLANPDKSIKLKPVNNTPFKNNP